MNLPLETSRVIGLMPPAATAFDFADEVRAGLPVQSVERLSRLVAPEDAAYKFRLVPKATYARRLRDPRRRLSIDESERVSRHAALWAQAFDIWKDADTARRFLWTPHMLLKGRRPIDLAETGAGARLVEELLLRLVHGIAA